MAAAAFVNGAGGGVGSVGGRGRRGGPAGPPPLPAWMAGGVIRSDGWSLDAASTPPAIVLDDTNFTITRPGFDSAGNPTSYATTAYVTRRVRAGGNLLTLDPLRCGLSEIVTAIDTVPGMTNASTETYTQPVAAWAMLDGDVVSDTLPDLELHALTVFGAPVLVRFTATDGTNTLTWDVTTMSALKKATDIFHICAFRVVAPNVASLNNGLITVNAQVFPKYGNSAAILNTATTGLNWWHLAPRYFIKDTVRAANPPVCFISPTGNNTTGIWSTDPVAARAAPFLSVAGAYAAAKISTIPAGAYLPTSNVGGCIIYGEAGTHVLQGNGVSSVGTLGAVVRFMPAPGVAKSACIWTTTGGGRLRHGSGTLGGTGRHAIRFEGCTAGRQSNAGWTWETGAPLNIQLRDCFLDCGTAGTTVPWLPAGSGAISYDGVTEVGTADGNLVSGNCGLARGFDCKITFPAATALMSFRRTGPATALIAQLPTSLSVHRQQVVHAGAGIAMQSRAPNQSLDIGTSADIDGLAITNVLFEYIEIAGFVSFAFSADARVGDIRNAIIAHVTFLGCGENGGRWNYAYVDNNTPISSRDRIHKWLRTVAIIVPAISTKHDRFVGGGPGELRVGGWPVLYGNMHDFIFTQYRWTDAGDNAMEYAGRGSQISTAAEGSNGTDLMFVNYQAALNNATPGVGGGDYNLQSGSPAKNRTLPEIYVPFTINGAARGLTTDVGAF